MKAKNEPTLIEIYSDTVWHAGMLKSILEDSGIEVFMANENLSARSPWLVSPSEMDACKVMISSLDYDKAKPIVDEFVRNLREAD